MKSKMKMTTALVAGLMASLAFGVGFGNELAKVTFGDKGELVNPERGYRGVRLVGRLASDGKWNVAETRWTDADARANGVTILQAYCYLTAHAHAPSLPEAKIAALEADFAAARKAGVKWLLRFAYETDIGKTEQRPSLETVLGHMAQLKPVLARNMDVIYCLQIGWLGPWGEFHNDPKCADPKSVAAVVKGTLDLLPEGRMTMMRHLTYKEMALKEMLGENREVTAATALTMNPEARIGLFNDASLAFGHERRHFGNDEFDRALRESPYVPVDGELFWNPENERDAKDPNYWAGASALAALARFVSQHYTTFSIVHGYSQLDARPMLGPIDGWKATPLTADLLTAHRLPVDTAYFAANPSPSAYDYIRDHLGYRLNIVVVSKDAVTLRNTGFARPVNPRPLIFVRVQDDGSVREFPSGFDWRTLVPNEDVKVAVPPAARTVPGRLAFWLPDADDRLRFRPEYAVRLADVPVEEVGGRVLNVIDVQTAVEPALAMVGERTMKTYPFSDPDPVPCIGEKRYPYCRYDGSTAVGEPKAWRTVTLENGLVRVTLMPEIGGKVWGATDLRTGVDFVYDNHVVKFRDIATRGPWTSGGIEYNFGIVGHAPSCSTPVDWFVRTNEDASVSCFIASEEYVTRSRWQVEVRLRPGAEEFETHTTWYNASGLPQPYYHWMNAAYSVRGNPRFLFPGSQYIGHSGDVHPWPIDEKGHDLSVFDGNAFGGPKSYHVLPGANEFYGIWWPEKGVGAYHRSEHCEKYGRKVWLWALSREGGIWEDLLTDADGQYTELQSGRCFQQPEGKSENTPFGHPLFVPGSTERFTEHWGVLRDPKVSDDLNEEKGLAARPTVAPDDFDRETAHGLYLHGRSCFSDRDKSYAEAEESFRKSLAKDAYFRPSLVALAALEIRRGNYAPCHRLCERLLSLDAYDTDANYLDGFAYFAEGDDVTARDRLGVAAFDSRNRSSAYALVARTYLREGKSGKARLFAEKSLAANAANLDALLVKAIALRGADAFRPFADDVLARYPLFHAVRYLRDGESFRKLVCNEMPDQTFVEMGSWFEESGLKDDARRLFALAAESPVAQIRLAFLKDDAPALAAVAKLPVGGVAPFRRESLRALRWAADRSASWQFRYYLAVALAALDRGDEADALFGTLDDADDAVVFLVRAARRTGAARLADLRRAQSLDDSWRVGHALCACYGENGEWAASLREAAAYLAKFPQNNAIQSDYARALHRSGKNRECLDFLKDVVFLPSELRCNVSEIWRAAQKELGLEITYPENLGSGKPYPPDAAIAVNFDSCPKCPYRMKMAADGKSATVNLARLTDDNPDAATLEARKSAMSARAQMLMRMAESVKASDRSKRPLMGWSSWNSFRVNISDTLICEVAEAMATNGLRDAGYNYVNIDDGFFGGRDEKGRLLIHPTRFPNGLKPVVDKIHALGLKAGIYSDAGADTCGSMYDKDAAGCGSGLYGHDLEDCRFYFGETDFDFIKIDYCGGQKLGLDEQERYTAIRKAIDATGKKGVRMNICRWTFPGEWAAGVAESWRTTHDIHANWKSVKSIIDENIPLAGFMRVGRHNDMDMLEVGRIAGSMETTFAHRGDKGLTRREEATHFGVWCFMSSPLLIGCDARKIDAQTLALVTNPFLLAMNQNDLGAPVRCVLRRGDAYMLVKDCDKIGGTARYLALYNGGGKEHEFEVNLFALDLAGKVTFFDLAERADLGEVERKIKLSVPPHGARFYRLDAERRRID